MKFKINNKACTSFKIEKIKLPLTMPHPQADRLPPMPHPGEDKVVKCPTNARGGGGGGGGMSAVGIDGAIIMITMFITLLSNTTFVIVLSTVH